MDERAYVTRFAAAPPGQLARLVVGASPEQREVLGAYLGHERFNRLLPLAVQAGGRKPEGNPVVFIPGFLGSALVVTREGESRTVWVDHEAIRQGWFRWLRLAPDGRLSFDPGIEVRPAGVLNVVHGDVLLKLAERRDVRAFAYDWRKDMRATAAELEAFLRAEFGAGTVDLVAHGSGAIVARAMLAMRPGASEGATRVARLVTLGEPKRGTHVVPRILAGVDPLVTRIGLWSALGSPGQTDEAAGFEAAKAFASFPALYQLMPRAGRGADSEERLRSIEPLYRAGTYSSDPVVVTQDQLDEARAFLEWLDGADLDPAISIVAVEGYGQPTPVGLDDFDRRGDGVVPTGPDTPVRYVRATTHGGLVSDPEILAALDDLLAKGETSRLETSCPALPDVSPDSSRRTRARARVEDAFSRLVRRLRGRAILATRTTTDTPVGTLMKAAAERVSPDERVLEEMLAGDFHQRDLDGGVVTLAESRRPPLPRIAISLVFAGIEEVHQHSGDRGVTGLPSRRSFKAPSVCPIDALAVGHYLGVLPQGPELALDRALSRALRDRGWDRMQGLDAEGLVPDEGLVLTQYTARGLLRGELGQPFFLNDPRGVPGAVDRLIVVAGMGVAGRFGRPELTVLARELCWSLGRLGKRHLATVLIGSGKGNIPVADAVHAWLQGVAQALAGVAGHHPHLERITFAESDPGRIAEFDGALTKEVDRLSDELRLEYTPWMPRELEAIREIERQRRLDALSAPRPHRARRDEERTCTRVSVQVEAEIYRFGAITGTASIPERRIPLRHWLVEAANAELASEGDPSLQLDRGQFLGHLLIPEDLRPQFFTRDPLVLMLDDQTARIHWEMVAQTEADFSPGQPWRGGRSAIPEGRFPEEFFLGTARGLTRQLRTVFAPPPEPPPPPRRVLRVLVVADPAADAPLPGALEEGTEVAGLFESFNAAYPDAENRVEVVRLLGPARATATNVLREVMSRPYDVLHFAGHCYFDAEHPAASGWVFSDGQVLSADLLSRIDRVPKFVFSNACESGVTPDRPETYSRDLAPSFADAFFRRGVSNFICTAWPIDDLAARRFADRLYRGLLGLPTAEGHRGSASHPAGFESMHRAMLEARLAIARNSGRTADPQGLRTWGAYQHYGDPFFRFFHRSALR